MSTADRIKWDAIHAERGFFPVAPSSLVTEHRNLLPASGGRALDIAGGTGRHALWLADQGFQVTLIDISPVALHIAESEGAARGAALEARALDLEEDRLPPGPWDVILCFHYWGPQLFADIPGGLSEQGVLVYVQPTRKNLERHPKPAARFLAREGELLDLAKQYGLEVISFDEGWSDEGRHEAVLVARRSRLERNERPP